MSLPDGRYVFKATHAAKNLLGLFSRLEPQQALCYLPSRFYLYGVYAAVFLHKTKSVGVFQSGDERQEVTNLVVHFISIMNEAPLIGTHVCHGYGVMLKRLWYSRDGDNSPQGQHCLGTCQNSRVPAGISERDDEATVNSSNTSHQLETQQGSGRDTHDSFFDRGELECMGEEFCLGNSELNFPSVEEYLLGSFWPGITEFEIDSESGPSIQREC